MADLYGTPRLRRAESQGQAARQLHAGHEDLVARRGACPTRTQPDADVCVQRFLKELDTDYIDLVQIHCMTSPKWPKEMRKQMDLMEDLKRKGLIRAHGCSFHSIGALEAAADEPWVDVIHARINPFGLKMDGKPEEVVPVLRRRSTPPARAIIGMKIIGEGDLRDDAEKREQSVRFAMGLACSTP